MSVTNSILRGGLVVVMSYILELKSNSRVLNFVIWICDVVLVFFNVLQQPETSWKILPR